MEKEAWVKGIAKDFLAANASSSPIGRECQSTELDSKLLGGAAECFGSTQPCDTRCPILVEDPSLLWEAFDHDHLPQDFTLSQLEANDILPTNDTSQPLATYLDKRQFPLSTSVPFFSEDPSLCEASNNQVFQQNTIGNQRATNFFAASAYPSRECHEGAEDGNLIIATPAPSAPPGLSLESACPCFNNAQVVDEAISNGSAVQQIISPTFLAALEEIFQQGWRVKLCDHGSTALTLNPRQQVNEISTELVLTATIVSSFDEILKQGGTISVAYPRINKLVSSLL